VVEGIFAVVGDVEIGETVVVVVADGYADAVVAIAGVGEAGFFGDVGEGAVGILAVEAVPVFGVLAVEFLGLVHWIGQLAAVHQENVEEAVVVVIEEGDASAHGFD
jgi:hypothetical protein